MWYVLDAATEVVVPMLVAACLVVMGIWTIRASRGDLGRAVGVLVLAFAVVLIGSAVSDVVDGVAGRTVSVEILEDVIYLDGPPPR